MGSLSSKPRRKLGCLREFRRHRLRRVGPGVRTRVGLRGRWRGATWSQIEGSLGSRRVGEKERERVGVCSLEEGLGSLGSRGDRNRLVPFCCIIVWAQSLDLAFNNGMW